MMKKIQLKAIREMKNISQAYVARKMGISQSYYSKLESGRSKLPYELVKEALKAMDIESPHPIFIEGGDIFDTLHDNLLKMDKIIKSIESFENRIKKLESKLGIK